ncbi:MAG TPA: calcium-binding protein, partial [Actinomycetota bacterium]|nr:calcium-binding protein [Actinomycetota bacterium]
FDTIRVRAGDLDDTVSAAGSFFLGGTRADFRGGDGDDSLFGSDADDRLSGGDGDDRLEARDGFRTQHLDGGAGDDILVGGDAERFEHFKGGPGADVLSGGPRDDIGVDIARYRDRVTRVTVTLDDVANDGARGEGDNVLRNMEGAVGGRANDRFIGNGRANYFAGGAGNDVLDGRGQRPGGDELSGGSGDDVIRGSDGVDYIFANEGDDFVHGRNGRDELDAGPGSDTLDARDCGPDIVAGGRGRDVARLDRADLARAIEVSIRSRCAVVTG